MVRTAGQYRLTTAVIGYVLSAVLIVGGVWLTQRDAAVPSTKPEYLNSEFSAKLGGSEFVAKNTAPGITLIICGTAIVIVTIRRKFRQKTQWADDKHPGFTEVDS
jgi:hypothetical protein